MQIKRYNSLNLLELTIKFLKEPASNVSAFVSISNRCSLISLSIPARKTYTKKTLRVSVFTEYSKFVHSNYAQLYRVGGLCFFHVSSKDILTLLRIIVPKLSLSISTVKKLETKWPKQSYWSASWGKLPDCQKHQLRGKYLANYFKLRCRPILTSLGWESNEQT